MDVCQSGLMNWSWKPARAQVLRRFESYRIRHNAELAQLAEQPICGDSLQLLREIVIAYDAKTRKADQVMLKSISC